jgi:hypothetical protein
MRHESGGGSVTILMKGIVCGVPLLSSLGVPRIRLTIQAVGEALQMRIFSESNHKVLSASYYQEGEVSIEFI